MVFSYFRKVSDDPLNSPRLAALREQLLAHPKDEQVKAEIRTLDLQARRRYFHQLSVNRSGAWLAMGALAVFLLATHWALSFRKRWPLPQPNPNAAEQLARTTAMSRRLVAGVGACVMLGLLVGAVTSSSSLPPDLAALDKLLGADEAEPSVVVDFASDEEMLRNWPQFRGPGGNGVSVWTNTPLTWDAKSGAGVVWKSKIPVSGFNSPIVWGERVFISGGDAKARQVLSFSVNTGDLLWQQSIDNVPGRPAEAPDIPEQTGYAASTMATDGRRVYAIFANGDLAALTFEGKQVWSKNFGVPKNPHGHATSLATWQGRVIVQLDQGESEQNLSKLYAIDGPTGRVIWQKNRPVPASWASPIVIDAAGKAQIITLAVPWVIAYAAKDGSELWRAGELNGEITPSPIFAAGLVFAISPYEKIMGIRPDGQGDVTESHISWFAEESMPDISSPVSNGELVFTASTPGMLTCFDAKDGKKLWEQELGMECNASPSIAGNRLFVSGGKGVVLVIEAGRTYKELARNELGEPIFASPAFANDRIFFRGAEHLFCIGQDAKLAAAE